MIRQELIHRKVVFQKDIFFLIKMCGKENIAYYEQKLDFLYLIIYKE
jgi:hypothetical protein